MTKQMTKYAICLKNRGYSIDLKRLKAYRVISDPKSADEGMIRVIDESGEDYLYPCSWFHPVELPIRPKRMGKCVANKSTEKCHAK